MSLAAPQREKRPNLTPSRRTLRKVGVPSGCRAQRVGDVRAAHQQLHSEILDNILTQLRIRFKDHEKLMFLAFLDPKKFASYRENFPSSKFQSLAENCTLTSPGWK